ncbi:hypothetical protein SAMN06297387_12121 [Streptomyces zhaozhouensis]|uniref:Uncharacterized protein n=1 Tax=Streptomyces zhaozhouensis TaxID=1300267 RepID=A0A286E2N7_9ACTN|nr:hypothetical protein [Streptomyces zhaozhouensis]SOD65155.1 hypothetical protein SAMN06297387_12121 [Streptomyces zhaozhouensis]
MRVPRQPDYHRLAEPADRRADEPADGGRGEAPDPWAGWLGWDDEDDWDEWNARDPLDRPRWPRWVALAVAAAVLLTAALGWTARKSAPPPDSPAVPPSATEVDDAPGGPAGSVEKSLPL